MEIKACFSPTTCDWIKFMQKVKISMVFTSSASMLKCECKHKSLETYGHKCRHKHKAKKFTSSKSPFTKKEAGKIVSRWLNIVIYTCASFTIFRKLLIVRSPKMARCKLTAKTSMF